MHEEMEYAEMLEIPVTTVNVVKKKGRKPKKAAGLKEKVISKVNDGAPAGANTESAAQPTSTGSESAAQSTNTNSEGTQTPVSEATAADATTANTTAIPTQQTAETAPSAQTSPQKRTGKRKATAKQTTDATPAQTDAQPTANEAANNEAEEEVASAQYVAESVPVHIPRRKKVPFFARLFGKKAGEWETGEEQIPTPQTAQSETPDEAVTHEENATQQTPAPTKKDKSALVFGLEFAAACALCLGIFLTNVFMPNSAINTFFRFLATSPQEADARTYADFTLSGIIYEEGTELTVSETGVLSFTDAGCVYPAVDGIVTDVLQEIDGTWTVKISHSPSFSEVINGLSYAPLQVGDSVKSNIPVGYSDGTNEVQVTMYDSGELLNCFHVTESGGLAWTVED